ncbi:MAG TPA: glycosyltransferase [Thermoanaerobaculia bacterium]|nr:glycosyltransferase [Thermoanaerobaculia bacterium]
MSAPSRLRVLLLSRNYPNSVFPRLGLWVQWLARHLGGECDVTVIAPVPWWPPLPGPEEYSRFRKVEPSRRDGSVEVLHPRFLAGPGYLFHSTEAVRYDLAIRRLTARIHRERRFDLVHAQFGYPDGVVAARLSRRLGIPAIVTEHAFQHPWLDDYPLVRRQTLGAQGGLAAHIAVSDAVRRQIVSFMGPRHDVRVIPVGVDPETFFPRAHPDSGPPRVLYVGYRTRAKGVDVLIEAAARLARKDPEIRFLLVGDDGYRDKRIQADRMRARAAELGLSDRITFAPGKPPQEVAGLLRESSILVLPSRRETFGAVLVEALASGTPVVATRCGGPEEIVTRETGVLVPPEDPEALARGIEEVLRNRGSFDPAALARYAVGRFSWDRVAKETIAVYREALTKR